MRDEKERTGNGTGTLIAARSTSSLVRSDGGWKVLLVLQDLCRDTLKCLSSVDSYQQ
jgi:hypothetical protein